MFRAGLLLITRSSIPILPAASQHNACCLHRVHPPDDEQQTCSKHVEAYLLTPCCRVLLEKLTGLQLVKKFPAFHGTRRFITALTSFRHLSLSRASPIQSIYPHPTSWRSILILSTHLCLGLPSGLLPSSFPTKTLYTTLSSPIRATCPAHLILLDFITRTILGEQYKSFISSLCSLLHSPRYLVPPMSKYSPQHHVLKHPQLPFLPQCQRPIYWNKLTENGASFCLMLFWHIAMNGQQNTKFLLNSLHLIYFYLLWHPLLIMASFAW